ncbi:FAD-dependent oxidoreductase [Aquirufa sp. 5-AUSEE-100C1]
MNRIVILGAGPAGLTAAYELSKSQKHQVDVIEISGHVGGMARSFKLFNQTVDVGPHRFFSSDARINKLWLEVVEKEYKMVNRTTRIYYKNKFFNYPLKAFNALINLGIFETILCVFSYFLAKVSPPKKINNFETWVVSRFGYRLFSIFFKDYTEKLWGISCKELGTEFAEQRIKKFSLGEAILSLLPLKKNNHKTLVDQFAYPLGGNGEVYLKMADKFQANGGRIHFNKAAEKIEFNENTGYRITLTDGEVIESKDLISTMPINNLIDIFEPATAEISQSAKALKFRNTIILYVNISKENLFKDQWLYIQDNSAVCGRITNFNNWVPEIREGNEGNTVLALEYWCFENDAIWSMDEAALREIALKDLLTCKFIDSESEAIGFHPLRVPKCYPIYFGDYKFHLDRISTFFDGFQGLQLIGRYGSFKYNNQDHSILMGHLAAENILANKKNNLWEINTDYEYQESSTITATGLAVG